MGLDLGNGRNMSLLLRIGLILSQLGIDLSKVPGSAPTTKKKADEVMISNMPSRPVTPLRGRDFNCHQKKPRV